MGWLFGGVASGPKPQARRQADTSGRRGPPSGQLATQESREPAESRLFGREITLCWRMAIVSHWQAVSGHCVARGCGGKIEQIAFTVSQMHSHSSQLQLGAVQMGASARRCAKSSTETG